MILAWMSCRAVGVAEQAPVVVHGQGVDGEVAQGEIPLQGRGPWKAVFLVVQDEHGEGLANWFGRGMGREELLDSGVQHKVIPVPDGEPKEDVPNGTANE